MQASITKPKKYHTHFQWSKELSLRVVMGKHYLEQTLYRCEYNRTIDSGWIVKRFFFLLLFQKKKRNY